MKEHKILDLACAVATGIVAVVIFFVVERLWTYDLNVPFVYNGDALGLQTYIKYWLNGEKWSATLGGSAPFTANHWMGQQIDGPIFLLIMFVIAKITKSVGYTINITFLITYFLSAFCTYIFLKKNKVSRMVSVVGSVIYAFIPGHFFRNISHLMVGASFAIPLIVDTSLEIANGLICKKQYRSIDRISFGELWKSADKKVVCNALLNIFLVSMSTLYYGFFSLMILAYASVYAWLKEGRARQLFYGGLLILQNLIFILLIFIPQFILRFISENEKITTYVSRYASDVETYGLKFSLLILPIQGHRLLVLNRLRALYDSIYPMNESAWSSLGLIMSIGLVVSIVCTLIGSEKEKIVRIVGSFNIFLILVGTIGGVSSLVGMFFFNIRCYNRLSYFIGAYSLLVSMILLDKVYIGLLKKKYIARGVIFILLVLGVLDQIPKVETGAVRSERVAEYYADQRFVESIEEYEGNNAMIIVFPLNCSLLGGGEVSSDGGYLGYEQAKMQLHAKTSKWNTGMGIEAGTEGDYWEQNLHNMSYENQVKTLIAAGYSGIAIYSGGFSEEKYVDVIDFMESYVGNSVCKDDSGKWVYYSFGDIKEKLQERYTKDEWDQIHREALLPIACYDWDASELYGNDRAVLEIDGFHVYNGGVQYGPYTALKQGVYNVTVTGGNLNIGEFTVTCYEGADCIEIENLSVEDGKVGYRLSLAKDVTGVEFKCENRISDEEIVIKKVRCVLNDDVCKHYVARYLESVQLEKRK